ncbi:MAG: phenylalanine 4-monooxygenase [Actinomycetota bacterium]
MVDVAAPDGLELPDDHPGFADADYRQRRADIARAGEAWRPGDSLPVIGYSDAEDGVWQTVLRELEQLHATFACRAYRDGAGALDLPTDRVPQLGELDGRLARLTGFRVVPVAGLVPARTFYGNLSDATFMSTQYLRHTSVPFYTPEPDLLHEVVGHLNLIAHHDFAELHRLAGEASRRCVGDAAHEFFSRVFWFTLEFGVVHEDGEPRAYGAGLASSFGEIQAFRRAEIRPFDLATMGRLGYDITTYQPVLFAAESHAHLVDELGGFFSTFDDDAHARLLRG